MNRIKNQNPPRSPAKNPVDPVNPAAKTEPLVPLLLSWFAHNARDLPWRRTRDPYAIWVSEIMLQQTQVKTVIPFWERWMRELPTIESLADAPSEKIHKLWEGLGYYTRVRNMQKAARQILSACSSRREEAHSNNRQSKPEPPHVVSYKFPEHFDDVLALPGIGRYTAGAICSIAFNQPAPILDGNVIRVLTRIFGITENPREKETNARLWTVAEALVQNAAHNPRSSRRKEAHSKNRKSEIRNQKFSQSLLTSAATREMACSHLNQSLMELGALVCTPRTPQCDTCPVKNSCTAQKKNLQEQLPNLGKRTAATERRFLAFIVERDGKFLVRQRPAGVVNAHLWEFPNMEVGVKLLDPQDSVAREMGFAATSTKPFCIIKHSITRYRITLEAYRGESSRQKPVPAGGWLPISQLKKLSFPSAHRKILSKLAEIG